ncbi:MAG: hypothetical protein R2729_26075 [Bryobacteraceae bacterium]
MKASLVGIALLVILAAAMGWVLGPIIQTNAPSSVDVPGTKAAVGAIVTTAIAGLLVALLVFLILDRWRRIENEMLVLRQAQEKALDDLRRRADERINEKLENTARQAQAIRDHVSNLIERYPWIKGISDADFTPDSSSCQIVLRNSIRFVAQGQDLLAHEYLFSWTRTGKDRPKLDGSVFDYIELANFALYVLEDEYLCLLMLSEGYSAASRQQLLAPMYLKGLVRHGMLLEAMTLSESLRRRTFPTWREKVRRLWRQFRNLARPLQKDPRPTSEEFAAFAVFEGMLGDRESFDKAIGRAIEAAVTERDRIVADLAKAEGLSFLGESDQAGSILSSVKTDVVAAHGLTLDLVWTFRRASMRKNAEAAFRATSDYFRGQVVATVRRSQASEGADDEDGSDERPEPERSPDRTEQDVSLERSQPAPERDEEEKQAEGPSRG